MPSAVAAVRDPSELQLPFDVHSDIPLVAEDVTACTCVAQDDSSRSNSAELSLLSLRVLSCRTRRRRARNLAPWHAGKFRFE